MTPGGRRGLSPGPEHAVETSWMANIEPNPLEPLLWVIDSGASRHMTFSRESFSDYMPLTEPILITTANGATIQALGQGTVPLRVTVQGTERAVALTEVLYAPGLSGSLISVLQLQDRGITVRTTTNYSGKGYHLVIERQGSIIGVAKRLGKAYTLIGVTIQGPLVIKALKTTKEHLKLPLKIALVTTTDLL